MWCKRTLYALRMSELAPERVIERIRQRIFINDDGCWQWQGGKSVGYGRVSWSGGEGKIWRLTHRVMWERVNGPIPDGLDLDHLCHDPANCSPAVASDCPHRSCCNPDHLKPATRQENLLRGGSIAAKRAKVTQCPEGHPLDENNTLMSKRGQRRCKQCAYKRNRDYYWMNRERRAEYNREWRARQSG